MSFKLKGNNVDSETVMAVSCLRVAGYELYQLNHTLKNFNSISILTFIA